MAQCNRSDSGDSNRKLVSLHLIFIVEIKNVLFLFVWRGYIVYYKSFVVRELYSFRK